VAAARTRAGHAQLLGAVLGAELGDRMQVRVARFAPKNSSGAANAWPGSVRLLIQTSRILWPCQSVNRLTL
jgi:hypothetical protein